MKRNLLSAFITLSSILFITSCGDSYSPITLASQDGKTIITNNDTIKLTKFTGGELYNIKGGNGKYFPEIINKKDTEIFKFSYDGNTISITPVNEGNSYLSISDSEENESRFVVAVAKMDKFYNVESHNIEIIGYDAFTDGERKKLTKEISDNALVKVGGKFEFLYTNSNNGIAKIKSTESSNYNIGTFTQEDIFNQQTGEKILSMRISLTEEEIYTLYLSEKHLTISQDLTSKYKGAYPNLESAILKYNLSQQKETSNNDKSAGPPRHTVFRFFPENRKNTYSARSVARQPAG